MKKCILILDDDQEILTVCTIILEKENYRVESRMSCDNIINDAEQVKPDIVLMDLWIPNIGGENAVKLMKKDETIQNIPVIIFSANAEIEEICKRSHANGFLKKPFEISTLLNLLEKNLSVVN